MTNPTAAAERQEMKVWKLNDCDWFLAETLEQAIAAAMDHYELPRDEVFDDSARELTPDEMNQLTVINEDDDIRRTFAEQLALDIAAGEVKPRIFACTEY